MWRQHLNSFLSYRFVADLPTFGHSTDDWLESSSNLHEMMELADLEEVKNEAPESPDENDHQALIDEVEHFLHQHETSIPMIEDISDEVIIEVSTVEEL